VLPPFPLSFFKEKGVKKTFYSPSLAKRRGWGMSCDHWDFIGNTTFFEILLFFYLKPDTFWFDCF
jgi:hypothetical protein